MRSAQLVQGMAHRSPQGAGLLLGGCVRSGLASAGGI